LTFRYADAVCGCVKFHPLSISVEEDVWRDADGDYTLTKNPPLGPLEELYDTDLLTDSSSVEAGEDGEEEETEVEIAKDLSTKRKENPLFDLFAETLSTEVLKLPHPGLPSSTLLSFSFPL
jgi:hypothetical protein